MSATQAAIPRAQRRAPIAPLDAITFAIVGIAVLLLVVGAVTTSRFLSIDNVRAILTATGFVGIVACGMTAIVLSGNLFSLSLGTTAAVGAMAFLAALKFGIVAALALTLVLGTLIGLVQGVLVGTIAANPIIVTIAAGALQSGVAVWASGGASVFPPAGDTSFTFLNSKPLGLAFSVYVLIALVIVLELLLRKTRFGRQLYLVGENREAARAAALPVGKIAAGAFAIAGFCAALAGILLGAFNQNATLLVGGTYTYDAIAAALVGGSAVTGGRGSVVRTLVGALVISVISNMLLLRGYSTGVQILVRGLVVFVVVVLVQIRNREGQR